MSKNDMIKKLLYILGRIHDRAILLECLKKTVCQLCSGSGELRERPYLMDCPLTIDEILAIDDPFLTDCYFTILHIQDAGYGATTLEEICYFHACLQKERIYSLEDFENYLNEMRQSRDNESSSCIAREVPR